MSARNVAAGAVSRSACAATSREGSLSELDNTAAAGPTGPAGGYAVWCRLDVGKSEHPVCALDPAGQKVYDRALPNDEAALRGGRQLSAHGRVLVVVDQPASIGALAIAVARDLGVDVVYLPGLAMRWIADRHPGQAKTDARDAYVIADAARRPPRYLSDQPR